MPSPTFSIIIPCRNPGRIIRDAWRSISSQQAVSYEVIFVDSCSEDGTAEWLNALHSSTVKVVSSPDRSVYEAMNKGAKLASGEWLIFLGADDQLAKPDALACVQTHIGGACEQLFCGEVAFDDGRVWTAPWKPNPIYRNFFHHQAAFYRRALFNHLSYDESFKIQADYDLNLRLWLENVRPVPLQIRVAQCSSGGLSDKGYWTNYREEITIRHRYFSRMQCLPWDTGSILRYLRKKILRNLARKWPEYRPSPNLPE